eukprot:m.83684 g.83684  ORF g.83684 m.83684 type:complete len:272 (+) comp12931_c0_seq7:668-1483(+)
MLRFLPRKNHRCFTTTISIAFLDHMFLVGVATFESSTVPTSDSSTSNFSMATSDSPTISTFESPTIQETTVETRTKTTVTDITMTASTVPPTTKTTTECQEHRADIILLLDVSPITATLAASNCPCGRRVHSRSCCTVCRHIQVHHFIFISLISIVLIQANTLLHTYTKQIINNNICGVPIRSIFRISDVTQNAASVAAAIQESEFITQGPTLASTGFEAIRTEIFSGDKGFRNFEVPTVYICIYCHERLLTVKLGSGCCGVRNRHTYTHS